MEYRSVADLDEDVRRLAADLPSDVDLVVGVPRSGLLAGNLLALHLNAGLTTVEGFRNRRLLDTGPRYDGVDGFETLDRVIVVDDSVLSGAQMRSVRATLEPVAADVDLEYAAVYVAPRNREVVDHVAELVGEERIFEWTRSTTVVWRTPASTSTACSVGIRRPRRTTTGRTTSSS